MLDKIMAISLVLLGIAAFGLYMDNKAKAAHITDLELAARNDNANIGALVVRNSRNQRITISYRDAIQGLNPDALSEACRTDPALLAAVAATRGMRTRFEADASGSKPASRLPAAADNGQPGH